MNSERFNGANAAMLLIDHQIGTMSWVRSAPFEEIKRNTAGACQGRQGPEHAGYSDE